jgi:hypothetical protein
MMTKIERFEDLKSWQKARQLANVIYDLTNSIQALLKIFSYATKSEMQRVQRCTTLQKALTLAPTQSSSDS